MVAGPTRFSQKNDEMKLAGVVVGDADSGHARHSIGKLSIPAKRIGETHMVGCSTLGLKESWTCDQNAYTTGAG